MIKVYINNEEVLCDKNIVIKKEMLNTSSTILNNVYPKSWETTHDYTTNYYYPLDYSNCKITDIRETPAEEGQTIEGTNFNINVDLSKEYSFDSFKGNTTQNGTPTPNSPVNVNVVTGEQEIEVCGKNLCPTNINDWESGEYNFTNGVKTSNTSRIRLKNLLKVEPNTQYYFNTYATNPNYKFLIRTYDETKTFIGNHGVMNNGGVIGVSTAKYLSITMYNSEDSSVNFDTYTTLFESGDIKPFICLNSVSDKSYEEYIGNTYSINLGDIELCKIGDYQDRIYKDSGKWYLEKKIKKVVFDGSEEWQNRFGESLFGINLTDNKININSLSYCNYFNFHNIQRGLNTNLLNGEYTIQIGTTDTFYCKNTNYSNTTDFKTWLSTHNTIVYYVLKTPTTTEITDTELINQLESIELIEGINNISSNGNLPIIMNLHYNYVTHRIDTILLFSGIVKNTGNISLNPREPHYSSIEVLGYETFLSEGETLDFVIYEKTIEEAIDLVINTISDYGIIKGNINIKNPNDIIGAYSTKDKTAYDVFNYIADITQSRWTTRIIDENTIAIDFYDPDLMTNGTNLDFTQEFFANNNIIDMQYNYGTRDYRNKQVMNSSAVYSNIETNETIIADGYQTQFNTTDKIGEITKMTLNGTEVIVKTKDEYELGYTCDFYYTPGNNYFESVDLVNTGAVLVIDYYAIIQGREILLNNTEINRVSSMTGRKGVISRYEDRNDATTTTELSQIGQSYLRYKGSPEIILKIESLNDIWNIGEKVEFNNAPLNELATEYMVKKKTIHYIPTVDNIFYDFELTSNFNSENAINYFDNQRSKNKGNIGQGETISRNIDISNTANVIFYDVDIQEVSIDGDNTLNSTLNSPLVQ